MASHDPQRDPPSGFERSPMLSSLILLALYVAMYLSVAAVMHALEPAHAESGPPGRTTVPSASNDVDRTTDNAYAAVPAAPVEWLRRATSDDAPPDCRGGAPFDARCYSD